jgi:hypothetical protein
MIFKVWSHQKIDDINKKMQVYMMVIKHKKMQVLLIAHQTHPAGGLWGYAVDPPLLFIHAEKSRAHFKHGARAGVSFQGGNDSLSHIINCYY